VAPTTLGKARERALGDAASDSAQGGGDDRLEPAGSDSSGSEQEWEDDDDDDDDDDESDDDDDQNRNGSGAGDGAEKRLTNKKDSSKKKKKKNKKNKKNKKTVTMSLEKAQSEARALVQEFVHLGDISEAVACVQELQFPRYHHVVVRVVVETAASTTSRPTHEGLAQLLAALHEKALLTPGDLVGGFEAVLEQLDDLEVDVPFATQHVGQLLSAALRLKVVPINFLSRLSSGEYASALSSARRSQLCSQVGDSLDDF